MTINKIYSIVIVVLFIFSNFSIKAQELTTDSSTIYSLEDIQEFAIEHNYEVQNTALDMEIAKKQKWETTAIGLPQVSGTAEYQNFPDIPTQLMPNFITPAVVGVNQQMFGLTPIGPLPEDEKIPVQFGSEHNTSWGITVSQLVFSGEYIVGLKASKIYLELSKTNNKRKQEEVKETVTKTYYLILITQESISVLDSLYAGLIDLQNETQKLQDAGFIEETDVTQIKLNAKNTENSINSMKQQQELLYRLLKFQSGIDYAAPISLSTDLSRIVSEIDSASISNQEFDLYANTDYRSMQVQESLSNLELQREKSTVLPQLAAFYSYSRKAMQDEFDLFSDDAEWYPTSVWGLKLSVPIFSSGQRWARIKQKQYKLEQVHNIKEQNSQALRLDFAQTKSDYNTISNNLTNIEDSKILSQKVYSNTLIKYKAGTASGLELTQAQTQYFVSLSEYYRTLGNLIDVHIKMKRLLNQL